MVVGLSCLVSGAPYIFPTLHIMGSSYLYHSMHQLHHVEEEPLFTFYILVDEGIVEFGEEK